MPVEKSDFAINIDLNDKQRQYLHRCREFADAVVAPMAAQIDQQQSLPVELISKLAKHRYFAYGLPEQYGGIALDAISLGLLHKTLGAASASVQGLLNVHLMALAPVMQWGSEQQKQTWLPALSRGDCLAAIAITESNVGSNASGVETTAERIGDEFILNGDKKWITCGMIADVFIVLAQCEGKASAFIVPSDTPGFSRKPIVDMVGCRGYMLAELSFAQCRLSQAHLLAGIGFGLSHVINSGLTAGRYNLSWACVGLADACLQACLHYTATRKQFGCYLNEHALVQKILTEIAVGVDTASLLCARAGALYDQKQIQAFNAINKAKYYASTTLNKIAAKALQLHGANGCSNQYPLERYFRDARIMELIEGSTQMLEIMIAQGMVEQFTASSNYQPQHLQVANHQ